jgi:DNA-binding GntR family transcriptional regulator
MDAFEQRDAARAERAMHDHLMAQLAALKKLRRAQARSPKPKEPGRAR